MVEIVRQNYYQNKAKFNMIKKEIIGLIGNDYPIHHVGSTAIPKMLGKNIIDILIGVKNTKELDNIQEILINHHYYLGKHCKKYYRFFASNPNETKSGDIHIHLAILTHQRYHDFLILKDYLLNNPLIANQYVKYKKEIIQKYGNNRQMYRRIKSIYVKKMLEDAKEVFKNN